MGDQVGVLLMAHGTPGRAEDVAPFYTRIRRGRAPSAEQLADLERRYAAIGGLSPLAERTRAQVDGVRRLLAARRPGHFVVAFGAKHTEPYIEDGAAGLVQAGVQKVIGLVLTPHGSTLGSGEYLDRAEAALAGRCPFRAVTHFYEQPEFVALMAGRVSEALAALGGEPDPARTAVIFTAHSLPARVRALGDTYPEQLEESARLVAAATGLARWQVAWQSAGRTPEPWLEPDVRDVVRQFGDDGRTDAVVLCPIGFVADHLEVLYDLDVEVAALAEAAGLRFARTDSLNDDPRFLGVLAEVVTAADAGF